MWKMLKYQYEPLQRPQSQIRILYLKPGVASDPVACTLTTVGLDKVLDGYEALSYTWGSSRSQFPIILNGVSKLVRPNLFSALKRLRQSDIERALWIDAVCIDQDNTEEKNAQVPLMRQVYRSASEVIVWLGDQHNFDVKAVFEFAFAAESAEATREHAIIELFDRHTKGAAGLREFFQLPYWTRVWIIQEVALANRCTLICGEQEGKWVGFSKLQRMFVDHNYEIHALREEFFVFDDEEDVTSTALPLAIEAVRCPRDMEPHVNLLEVLRGFRAAKSTDPRDKVIGILGLISLGGPTITVNYTVTTATVYTQCIRAVLSDSGRLDFLSDCILRLGPPHGLQVPSFLLKDIKDILTGPVELPSWVPNWTIPFSLQHKPLSALATKTPFNAGGDEIVVIQHSLGSSVLCVRGISVDEITLISGPWNNGYDDLKLREENSDLVYRVAAVDRNMDGSMYNLDTKDKQAFSHRDKPPSVMVDFIAPHGRRLFEGKEGGLGLAPMEAEVGDVVCVIWGCSVPIVLRKTTGGWLVVGEAYLHGHMDGQALSRRDCDDEGFTLL